MKKRRKSDPHESAQRGEKLAKERIRKARGFEDLAHFYVMVYTNEELDDLGVPTEERAWVGQYAAGSVNEERGVTVLVNADAHDIDDAASPDALIADTLCHEVGHALWELLDEDDRGAWEQAHADHRWGPEEAFADDFMFFVSGRRDEMSDEDLFLRIASSE